MEIRNDAWTDHKRALLDIGDAADLARVRVDYNGGHFGARHEWGTALRHTRKGGLVFRLVLKTVRDKKGNVIFGRIGFSGRRSPGHVCWHGHRAFMRALLTRCPDAVIITAFARYNGLDHFEQTHVVTAYTNIGSQYRPMMMSDACDCDAPTEE